MHRQLKDAHGRTLYLHPRLVPRAGTAGAPEAEADAPAAEGATAPSAGASAPMAPLPAPARAHTASRSGPLARWDDQSEDVQRYYLAVLGPEAAHQWARERDDVAAGPH